MKMKRTHHWLFPLTLLSGLVVFTACGDSGGGTTVVPPAADPVAEIAVEGDGDLVIHPSADPNFGVAIEFPIIIRETGGGSATFSFFRVSYFMDGQQIERNEIGAGQIRDAGLANIGPGSTNNIDVFSRTNVGDFDDIEVILGFVDNGSGALSQEFLDLQDFDSVTVDLTPALLPSGVDFSITQH